MAFEWTPAHISTLIALWTEGISTIEIGRRLDITKNSVVGKVHRLGLPKRVSPIGSKSRERKPASARQSPGVRKESAIKQAVALAQQPRPVPASEPVPKANPVSMEHLMGGMCSWPEGEPGKDDFHFCGAPILEGKPYCVSHCARAYVRPTRDRDRQRAAQNKFSQNRTAAA